MFGEFFYSRWAHQAKHRVFLVTAQRALPGQVLTKEPVTSLKGVELFLAQ